MNKKGSVEKSGHRYCSMPVVKQRVFGPEVSPKREELILISDKIWVNGTTLHYYLFESEDDGQTVFFQDGTQEFVTWAGSSAEKEMVRNAFEVWKNIGMGITFKEVFEIGDAEVRIGFMKGDGSWSYLGRDILGIPLNQRTMNFGWNISDDLDTILHEIGHTLGFPHEHQNPNAGIVWDEEAVYAELAGPPNFWDRDRTFRNIIRKISPDLVQGSDWDPNSIMHYPFAPGLIIAPEEYQNGLFPAPGLSPRDVMWTQFFYPRLEDDDVINLELAKSEPMPMGFGEQMSFGFKPKSSRKYHIRTFGKADGVMVLFKKGDDGELIYLSGDDDSGTKENAQIDYRLLKNEEYIICYRQFYKGGTDAALVLY